MSDLTKEHIDYLFTPMAIRETTRKVYDSCVKGETHFNLHLDKIDECVDLVIETIKENYPSLEIPFHSRWGHFKVGGINREKLFDEKIADLDDIEKARVKLDLVITSVLLDAGAGPTWKYNEDGVDYNRSEGLAVASYHMFVKGMFTASNELSADIAGLKKFSQKDLIAGFQITEENPLVGIEGRVKLINKLGTVVQNNPEFFPKGRPGSMIDYLISKHGMKFKVSDILDVVLRGFGGIWPSRIEVEGQNLGDIWHYAPFGELGINSVVCFHKLSQWMTYSIVSAMEVAGVKITGAENLTGLAEYRNGGLFVDSGVLSLKDKKNLELEHKPNSELIIEWRALTIQLLDEIGKRVQERLGKSAEEFPLAKVLEGGTWWAGRKLASAARADNSPPIKLDSDGTVF